MYSAIPNQSVSGVWTQTIDVLYLLILTLLLAIVCLLILLIGRNLDPEDNLENGVCEPCDHHDDGDGPFSDIYRLPDHSEFYLHGSFYPDLGIEVVDADFEADELGMEVVNAELEVDELVDLIDFE